MKIFNGTGKAIRIVQFKEPPSNENIGRIKAGIAHEIRIQPNYLLNTSFEFHDKELNTFDTIAVKKIKDLKCSPVPNDYDLIIVNQDYALACQLNGFSTDKMYQVGSEIVAYGLKPDEEKFYITTEYLIKV